jgi:hypothetical protein
MTIAGRSLALVRGVVCKRDALRQTLRGQSATNNGTPLLVHIAYAQPSKDRQIWPRLTTVSPRLKHKVKRPPHTLQDV